MNQDEIEQIREYADRPPERIKLYVKFIEQRTSAIKQLTDDLRAADRNNKIQKLLDEFTNLSDELQDNMDEYHRQHADLRKTLKELIPNSTKWIDIVRTAPAGGAYDISRKSALDSAQTLNGEAKEMLEYEEKYFITHKPDKAYEVRER